jgi:hypothetical protein
MALQKSIPTTRPAAMTNRFELLYISDDCSDAPYKRSGKLPEAGRRVGV